MTKPFGRPAQYRKPLLKTYRVSSGHNTRVERLKHDLGYTAGSDVVEHAVLHLYRSTPRKRLPR